MTNPVDNNNNNNQEPTKTPSPPAVVKAFDLTALTPDKAWVAISAAVELMKNDKRASEREKARQDLEAAYKMGFTGKQFLAKGQKLVDYAIKNNRNALRTLNAAVHKSNSNASVNKKAGS